MSQEAITIGNGSEIISPVRNPDSTLMLRLQRGEAAAMSEIVQRFGPKLHRLVGRLSGWSSDTDDILQEVFLTAWKKAHAYRGSGSVEGWLRKLAVNRCRNHHRAHNTFRRKLRELANRLTHTSPECSTSQSGAHDDLHAALVALPPADRTLLVLHYLEGHSGSEIAELMEIRVTAVHTRLHRARARLRTQLTTINETKHDTR